MRTDDHKEAMATAKETAEKLLAEYEAGEHTEDAFAAIGDAAYADGTAAESARYEDITPGQMVEDFENWCFDASRQVGDTGIVESTYGYHVMYYVSATENYYWKTTAEGELRYQDYNNILSEVTAKYTTVPTDKLAIPTPDAFKAIQKEAQADAAAGSAAG